MRSSRVVAGVVSSHRTNDSRPYLCLNWQCWSSKFLKSNYEMRRIWSIRDWVHNIVWFTGLCHDAKAIVDRLSMTDKLCPWDRRKNICTTEEIDGTRSTHIHGTFRLARRRNLFSVWRRSKSSSTMKMLSYEKYHKVFIEEIVCNHERNQSKSLYQNARAHTHTSNHSGTKPSKTNAIYRDCAS